MRASRLWIPIGIAGVLLLAQVGINIWQHTGKTRYFAWAPNDYLVTYDLHVDAGGRSLTVAEMEHRYRLDLSSRLGEEAQARVGLARSEHYVFEDAPQELEDRIRRYEETEGKKDRAHVSLTYQFDGGKEQTWQWPRS
ncbi:MAG TPA: hypothetical protein VHY83_02825 [Solirubrobacteraceae bacterium]|jgi:hypothetical protein|nr:hypothetical protein [Solirubrobacteraceae bacterium]